MSYVHKNALSEGSADNIAGKPLRVRLLYALGVAVLGYFTFNALILLGIVQFIYLAVTRSKNDEISTFSRNLLTYLREVMGFILFHTDVPPFPFAPFPGNKGDL
ncbi:MAG: DUF4389 domain-containing protein [Alphaproteobacteria bacterium]|nr:DUF4389 domain-containing protein [Alphaproteobacteria bacterium]